MGGGGGAGVGEEQPSRLREEKVGISPLTSPDLSQKKKAVREEGGEGDKEEDSGVQLPAGCGEPLLVRAPRRRWRRPGDEEVVGDTVGGAGVVAASSLTLVLPKAGEEKEYIIYQDPQLP